MLLLLLASHPACADDLDTLQILLLPIDKSLVDSDLVNVGVHTSFEIMRSPKNSFNKCIALLDVWAVAPSY